MEKHERTKITIISIIRYIIGLLFLFVGIVSLFDGEILPGVFSFLIGVILTPAIADHIENKIQMSLPAPLRVIAVFCLLIAMGATADPVEPTENIISDPIASETLKVNNSTVESVAPETQEVKADTPKVKVDSPEPEIIETPEEVVTQEASNDDAYEDREKDSTEDEYKEALAKQEAEKVAEPEETHVPGETEMSTTMQLSQTKKNDLIEIVKKYYGSDEVEVQYISPTESSPTGVMYVTYYLDVAPPKSTLENDLSGIVVASKSIAEESGITNPNVNVVAMLTDKTTPLGVGNYYSSSGSTDINVEDIKV
jgi:hypothetical protein